MQAAAVGGELEVMHWQGISRLQVLKYTHHSTNGECPEKCMARALTTVNIADSAKMAMMSLGIISLQDHRCTWSLSAD